MAGQRQPIELLQAKGSKHLTKAEIQERQAREIKPITDEIVAPAYLTKKQSEEFYAISAKLEKLKIMGETDVDALARYIVANDLYIQSVKQLRRKEVRDDPFLYDQWSKIQERYFKQTRSSANDLGLTISSRCRLVIPETKSEDARVNKFEAFKKASND